MTNERGVTLIEMIFAIVIIGIIGAVAAEAFLFSSRSTVKANSTREAVQVNRLAMDRMIREIRSVRSDRCVETADPSVFKFVDGDNNTVTYSWAGAPGNPLMRNADPLVDRVTNLSFTYLDNGNPPVDITGNPPVVCATPCAAACPATDIWSITVDLTTESGGETMRLRSRVHPRGVLN